LTKLFVQEYRGQVDERAARWLKLMEDNGEDIVRRVEGILSVARIGIGGESVMAVDSGLVLKDVLATHSEEIRRLGASIHAPAHLPIVTCHETYLRQLFDNLISNGLKYAKPQQPPKITLHWELQGNMVQFSIHDEGMGIPESQRDRVFEPFVRLKHSDAAGSGIGLTIVKRIVELYGGCVWIESSDDRGCTVTFTIPWFREDAVDSLSIRLADSSSQELQ
jgi:signal transduction histidine kinase